MHNVQITRVLCPVDFSAPSIQAYDHAVSVARHYASTLLVAHIIETWKHSSATFAPTASQYEQFCCELTEAARRKLQAFIRDRTPVDIAPECIIQEGTADDAILALAERHCASLIVIGTQGLRGLDRWMLGSVTEKVLRQARCPVLAVHGPPAAADVASAAAHRPIELREVLLCTDFSAWSGDACDYAFSLAAEYSANLTLLHVLEGTLHPSERGSAKSSYELLHQSIPEEFRGDRRISCLVRAGRPSQVIHELGREKKIDLIVMAVHGRNSFNDALFGSTTYRVLQLSDCPVLAVHSKSGTATSPLASDSSLQTAPSSAPEFRSR